MSSAASANGLRRALVARRQVHAALWTVGLGLFALGLLFAIEGVWAVAALAAVLSAVVTWFVGAWVVPRSRDAYLRRLIRLLQAWTTDTQWSYDRFRQKQSRFRQQLEGVSPPPEYLSEHTRLVELAEEHDRLRAERTASPSHARAVTATQVAARQVREKLARHAASDEQRGYVAELDDLLGRRQDEYATAAARSERATTDAVRKLARIRPPESGAAEHDALSNAFRAHLDVARAFHESTQAAEPERVAAAISAWDASVAKLRAAVQQVMDRLDFYERWPGPEPSASGADAAQPSTHI
jgi:hypothetical protein